MAAVVNGRMMKTARSYGQLARPVILAARFSTDNPCRTKADSSKNLLFDPQLALLKRGTGGRSSFNGIIATVFGATGLIGEVLCNRLGKIGTQLIIPYRCDPIDTRGLKLCGDLGQVLFFPFHLKDDDSVRKAMAHSNVVINLIGSEFETRNFKFEDIYITGPQRIARFAREAGIKRLIHFSALNANPDRARGVILPEGSRSLLCKYQGEFAVRDEYPGATIMRPADVYGQHDRFLEYYSFWLRRTRDDIALHNKGVNTYKAPIYKGDVAQAVINAIKDPATVGQNIDLIGPKYYQLNELCLYILRVLRADKPKIKELKWSPSFLAQLFYCSKIFRIHGPYRDICWEKLENDHVTDTPTKGHLTLDDLGIVPQELENRIHWEIAHLRNYLEYTPEIGEFPTPAPPPVATFED